MRKPAARFEKEESSVRQNQKSHILEDMYLCYESTSVACVAFAVESRAFFVAAVQARILLSVGHFVHGVVFLERCCRRGNKGGSL